MSISDQVVLKKGEKMECYDCHTEFEIPTNVEMGEIITCSGCGLEFEVKQIKNGTITLQELAIEGEDWGE